MEKKFLIKMDEISALNNEKSVYQLITLLCNNIAIESGIEQKSELEATVSKLRSKSFEILLKTSKDNIKWVNKIQNANNDAMDTLNAHLFALKLTAKAKGEDATNFERELLDLINNCESYIETEHGNRVLELLLALKADCFNDENDILTIRPKELLVPGPFTLHANYTNNHYYPKNSIIRIKNAEPIYFPSLRKMQANLQKSFKLKRNSKRENNLLKKPTDCLINISKKTQISNISNEIMDCTFTGMTRRHVCSDADWLRIDMRCLQINLNTSSNFYALQSSILSTVENFDQLPIKETKALTPTIELNEIQTSKPLINKNYSYTMSWDKKISQNGIIQNSKPFLGDVNFAFELQSLVMEAQKQIFEAKLVTKEQFLKDVKLLTVGLQSDTFRHNELIIFSMLPQVTVPGLLPSTIANYVQEFLDCGTCYKRLQIMTTKRDYKLMYDGFIFKALCGAVSEYLLTFRQFVFSFDHEESLIDLYKRMKKPMRLISNLSLTLAVSPGVDPKVKPPMGSQFLGYIYREIMRVTDNDYITLLMFLLKRCCFVYFKYLQLWIFHGVLDDASEELFIRYQKDYKRNTKYFYDRAYSVRKEAVPGFFQGYEEQILQCGKYTMLLKAYNPNHPIFDLDYPKISVRLSFDEIQKLELNCTKYAEKAREIFGKPINVNDIFEARNKRRKEFQQMVYQRSREIMERWNFERHFIAITAAEQKRKRFNEMTAQLHAAQQQRLDKRRENVEIELKALREAEKQNEERLKRENINLRKRVEYYQELSDVLQADALEKESISQRSRRYSFTEQSSGIIENTSRTPISAKLSYSTTTLDTYRANITEEDNISIYTECNSKNLELEFAKTAEELQAFCESRNNEYENNNFSTVKKVESFRIRSDLTTGTLHRSISDVINSNHMNDESSDTGISMAENPLQANRLKTLTGTIGLCLNDDFNLDNQSYATKSLRVSFRNDVQSLKSSNEPSTNFELSKKNAQTAHAALAQHSKNDIQRKSLPDINLNTITEEPKLTAREQNRKRMMEGPLLFSENSKQNLNADNVRDLSSEPLTELERNRQKVLTEEFAFRTYRKDEDDRKSLPDFDLTSLPDEMLNDRQRNRRRMMESPHPFTEFNKPALSARPRLNLALDTERARNRRKVLESEYNIVTGDVVLSARDMLTPMSTTSDPPLTEQLNENEQKSDILNGNLRLNVSIASKTTDESLSAVQGTSIGPSTAATIPPATPLDALTTAGLCARAFSGFDFPIVTQTPDESPIETGKLNLTSDFDEVDATLIELRYDKQYEWCNQLVKSKFQCPTQSNVFRLNLDFESTKNKTQQTESTCANDDFKNFKIDSLNIITLTKFLQKSIIIPMTTHLNLVNNEVMRVLLDDLHLIDHLRSLRHYFFMMDGEFGSIIGNGIIGRVENGEQPSKVLNYQTLHFILERALSGSIQKDPNADNLSFIVSEVPTKFELTSPSVLNVLSLSYRVQWPLNLLLNPETLERYGSIFKYLLKVHRISWVLERAFDILRQAAKQHGKRLVRSMEYLRIQQIRHKFYHFVHALQHHITSTALQASWKLFKDELVNAKSLESIYRMHTQYVKRILFLCMLNRDCADFNNAIESIFRICLKFYKNLKSNDFKERAGSKEFIHPRFTKIASKEEEFEKLIKYTIYLGNKIVRRGYQVEIGEFITLININQYYTLKKTN